VLLKVLNIVQLQLLLCSTYLYSSLLQIRPFIQYQWPRVERYNWAIFWVIITLRAESFDNSWPTETVHKFINCALFLWLLYRQHVITFWLPCVKTESDFIRVMPLEVTVPKTTAWCTTVKICLQLVYIPL